MQFEEKKILLKDGEEAILRAPRIEDAQELLNHLKITCGETDFLSMYPEEYDAMSVESEEAWITSHLESPDALVICCAVDGTIVGTCDLRFNQKITTSHRASLGITVQRRYWNLGIGSAMFEEMIAACTARGIEIMELEFLEGNDRAKHLYEKFGFRVVSEKPNAFKRKDGRMQKEYYMQKYL